MSPRGGDIFASGSEDGSVKIWDLGSFQIDPGYHENQHAILSKYLILKLCNGNIFYPNRINQLLNPVQFAVYHEISEIVFDRLCTKEWLFFEKFFS